MTRKPFGPTTHGVLDYGFMTAQILAPSLFNFKGSARAICYGSAALTGLINACTDHPVGLVRAIPLRVHGQLEIPIVPSLLLLPWATGAFNQKNARLYFIVYFLLALANFLLTDYNAYEPAASRHKPLTDLS